MTEERESYRLESDAPMGLRFTNFADDSWHSALSQRLHHRYPLATFISQKPHVVLAALQSKMPWTQEDNDFLATMQQAGYFRTWETVNELPPVRRANKAIYEEIGFRIGEGQCLTPAQSVVLLSQLHALEERAESAEQSAKQQRIRANVAEEDRDRTNREYNALIDVFHQQLAVSVYSQKDQWIAEDAKTGRILARAATVAGVYEQILRLRRAEK